MTTQNIQVTFPTHPGKKASLKDLQRYADQVDTFFQLIASKEDNEFGRTIAVVTFHADAPPEYKEKFDKPVIADVTLKVHTPNGTMDLNELMIQKEAKKPKLATPYRSYEKNGEKKYVNYFEGFKFFKSVIVSFGKSVKAGFRPLPKGVDADTKDAYDAVMALDKRVYVPKDKRVAPTTGTKDNTTSVVDEAEALMNS